MTDRIRTLTVHLKREIRDDDIQPLLAAISMLEPVAHVTAHVRTGDDYMATEQAKIDLRKKVFDALFGENGAFKLL